MKKVFFAPVVDVKMLQSKDVITTSINGNTDPNGESGLAEGDRAKAINFDASSSMSRSW